MTINLFGLPLLPLSARKPASLKAACRRALKSEKADKAGELNIIILDRKKMRALNKRYLDHDYDTDVIAFNYPADKPLKNEEAPFGDVYVSAYKARIQAKEQKHPVLKEVLTLVLHGTLHLLGYDDSTTRKKAAMFRKQDQILLALK